MTFQLPFELVFVIGMAWMLPIAILTVIIGELHERIKKLENTAKQSDDEILNKW